MTEKEKDLRVDILHLREELLISEGQLFYLLFHLLPRKKASASGGTMTENNTITTLEDYRNKLIKIKSSPFIYVTGLIKLIGRIMLFLPTSINLHRIKSEFMDYKLSDPKEADIINFGVIPYVFRKLRQQHLAEELACLGHRVFYIENRFQTTDTYKPGYTVIKKASKVYSVKLNTLRDVAIYHQKPSSSEIQSIWQSLEKLMKDAGIRKPILKIDHPFWTYLLPFMKYHAIYDCMDDYEGFEITGNHILELEKNLIRRCDITVVCSNILLEKVKRLRPKKTLLLKNACEYDHFAEAAVPSSDKSSKKTIGFFGAIGEWIDSALIGRIAKHFPQCEIILIGEAHNDEVKLLPHQFSNIRLLGEKPYSTLPNYLKNFDVCIIPFKVNSHTILIDPVKLYEYFASGKPVVTTAIEEIKEHNNALYYSLTPDEFIKNIETALHEKNVELQEARKKIAKDNTWGKRALVLHEEINNLIKNGI